MPLESQIPSREVNIKDLSVEAEQRGPVKFDLRKEITPEVWDHAEERLNSLRNSPEEFTYLGSSICLLDKKRAAQLITEDDKLKCLEWLKNDFDTASKYNWLYLAWGLNQMGVNLSGEFQETTWNWIDRQMDDDLKTGQCIRFMAGVFHIKCFDPQRAKHYEDKIPWNAVIKEINSDTQDIPRAFYGADEAAIKVLNPSCLKDVFNPLVFKKTLEKFRQEIKENSSGDDLDHAIEIASNLRILTAEEVKITQNGLEIIDKTPSLSKPDQPLPETKKF